MVAVSEPLEALVGGGKNAKYIKECTELHLGHKGIEKLRGFEPLVNLEVLWINGNALTCINNLDQNFRIKVLYAQDNSICSLKGSLEMFKFLEVLDLSNNQLRDLDKIAKFMRRFQFLNNLNLKDNPCCEEADYRLTMVHALPQLRVLDQHVITLGERRKAKGLIGGDIATLTVAFGKRAPLHDPAWDEHTPERSALEQELGKEVASIRQAREEVKEQAERLRREHDPYPEVRLSKGLPPPAGLQAALQNAASTEAQNSQGTAHRAPSRQDGYRPKDVFSIYTQSPRMDLGMLDTNCNMMTGSINFDAAEYRKFWASKSARTGPWEMSKTTVHL